MFTLTDANVVLAEQSLAVVVGGASAVLAYAIAKYVTTCLPEDTWQWHFSRLRDVTASYYKQNFTESQTVVSCPVIITNHA